MFAVVRPVGRNIKSAAIAQTIGDRIQKTVLYDSTFMVALLRPGIGKVKIDARQGCRRYLMSENVDGVMHQQTQVVDPRVASLQQAMTDTRLVDFNAEVVRAGVFRRLLDQGFAVAETDFKDGRSATSENCLEVQRCVRVLQAELGPQILQRF